MDPQIQMQGNLVADPTFKSFEGGLLMAKFRIAASGRRYDRARQEFVNTDPVYMSVVCWRQLADNVAKTLRKGDTVLVHGRLTFREYDDGTGGPRRQAYEIDATAVGPDLTRYRAELTRPMRDVEPERAPMDEAAVTGPLVPAQATDDYAAPLAGSAA